jgi:hypothetical protein
MCRFSASHPIHKAICAFIKCRHWAVPCSVAGCVPPELTAGRLAELLAQVDEVCRQARELQKATKKKLAAAHSADRLVLSGQPERRTKPRKK